MLMTQILLANQTLFYRIFMLYNEVIGYRQHVFIFIIGKEKKAFDTAVWTKIDVNLN